MSAIIDDGGPAYPQGHPEMTIAGQSVKETQGMTLRDYFAGQALANDNVEDHQSAAWAERVAAQAYAIADAMIAARKGGPQS